MKIKGLDNGYLYTKSISDNEHMIFKSAYSTLDKVISGTAYVNIDGKDYYIGAGKTITQVDKTDHEINKVCTLTNLALSGNNDYSLVVGLPIGQYKLQKDKFIKMIISYNNSEIIFKGSSMNINIKDVTVYPQGAGALYSMTQVNGDYILFDIGGLTIDVALIEMMFGSPSIQKYDTWYKGIVTQYSSIIEQVNMRYNLTLEPKYAEKILTNGLIIDGEKKDISFIQIILEKYLDDLFTDFRINYPSKTTTIYLCGGGASLLFDLFKKYFPQTILMQDCQFANATGFYRIGQQKYYKYISAVR